MSQPRIADSLLPWFDRHGRKDLPWQIDKDEAGYRVWLSEIMLQQTQVVTVIPYFERFFDRFSGFHALADADLDEVLSLWAGLGYYARARNLHRCARVVANEHAGCLPRNLAQLIELPGIGRSTAGAIMSLAFGEPAAILDGNVKRVLSRLYRVQGWSGQSAVQKELWRLAERQTPASAAAQYNQAMMDLGATLCTRSKPNCGDCPLSKMCQSYRYGEQALYPQSKPKKNRPCRHAWMLVHRNGNRVLLEKRPPSGIWGGLWSLPELDNLEQLADWQDRYLGWQTAEDENPVITRNQLRHQFSHFDLDISTISIEAPDSNKTGGVQESDSFFWCPLETLDDYGIPAPVYRLLSKISAPQPGSDG